MKKRLRNKISILLAIIMVVSVLMSGLGVVSMAEAGQDVTSKAGIKLKTVTLNGSTNIVNESGVVDPTPVLKVGDTLHVLYIWEIAQENIDILGKSNYFQVKLPDSEHFIAYKNNDKNNELIKIKIKIKLDNGGTETEQYFDFGHLNIVDGHLRITMDLEDSKYNEIKAVIASGVKGEMGFSAKAQKSGSNITIPNVAGVTIEIDSSTNTGGGTGGGSNSNSGSLPQDTAEANISNPLQDKALHKKGEKFPKYSTPPTDIEWVLNVNTDMIKGIYAIGFNVDTKKKSKVILIDRLPEGLEIDEDSFEIVGNVYAPALNSGSSVSEVTGKWIYSPKLYSKSVNPNKNVLGITIEDSKDGEAWKDFQERIEGLAPPVVGFYKKEGIVANFGDLPNSENYYDIEGVYKGKSILLDTIDAMKTGNKITQAQYDKIVDLYVTKKLPILDYTISFKSKIVAPVENKIVNNALLKWSAGQEESAESNEIILDISVYAYGSASGSVKKRDIPVSKIWKDGKSGDIEKVSIGLYKDGGANPIQTVEIKKSEGWKYIFKELSVYEAGKAIKYTVKELADEKYSSIVSGDMRDGFVITNTLNTPPIPPVTPPTIPDKPKPPTPPSTPDKPKPPVTPPSEPPSKPETPPSEPPVTPPTTPETPPNEPPVAPPTTPRYPPSNPPDPNDPDSPEIIEVIGDDGVPLGKYKKVPNDDGGFEYIDEEGIPLGNMKLVSTGNEFPEMGLIAGAIMSLVGISLLIAGKQRRSNKDRK